MEIINYLVMVFGMLTIIFMFGLFEQRWLTLNETFFRMLMGPIAVGETSLQRFWSGIRSFYRGQFENKDGSLNLNTVFFEFIGSVLYTASFLLFLFADFHLMCLTLAGMGIEAGHFDPPLGAGTLTVLSLMAAVLLHGTIFLDLLGLTSIAPWRALLTPAWRKILMGICISSLLLSLTVTGLAGKWRGDIIAESQEITDVQYLQDMSALGGLTTLENVAPSVDSGLSSIQSAPSDRKWIPIFINITIPILLGIGASLSGWGLVNLIKFIMLGILFVGLSPTGLILIILAYTARIIERVYELGIALIQLLASIGRWLMGLVGYTPPDDQAPPPSQSEQAGQASKNTNDDDNDDDDQAGGDSSNSAGFNPYDI